MKELRAAAAQPWSLDAYKQPSYYEGVFRQIGNIMRPPMPALGGNAARRA